MMECMCVMMVRCRATRKVRRGKLTGTIRCRKQIKAHELNPKLRHEGMFNKETISWTA